MEKLEIKSFYSGTMDYILSELIYETRPEFKFWSDLYIEYNGKGYEGKDALQLLLGLCATIDIWKLQGSTEEVTFYLAKK